MKYQEFKNTLEENIMAFGIPMDYTTKKWNGFVEDEYTLFIATKM